jgi:hypothetical protein
LQLFYKVADGTESGSANFTKNGAILNQHEAAIAQFSGVGSIEAALAASTRDPAAVTLSSPQLTTGGINRLLANFFACRINRTLTPEAGWTEQFEYPGSIAPELALHTKDAATAGVQTTEEPTPSSTATAEPWTCVALALAPDGTTASASIAIRATAISYINNANSVAISIPVGAQAGDSCFICVEHGWGATAPAGWNAFNNSTGSNINGACFQKHLTAADITASSVTVSFAGTYYGAVSIAVFQGSTGGARTWTFTRNSAGSTSRAVTTDTTPETGDYALYFGSTRGNTACSVDKGASLQASSNANPSACLSAGTLASDGAVTATFSYGVAGTGDYEGVLIVAPSPI